MKTFFLVSYWWALVALVLLNIGCQNQAPLPDEAQEPAIEPFAGVATVSLRDLPAEIARSKRDFSFRLFQQCNRTTPNQNLFLSPLSAHVALGMALNGADQNTAQEMRQTLGFTNVSLEQANLGYASALKELPKVDPDVELTLANSAWVSHRLRPNLEYMQTLGRYFGAKAAVVDFGIPSTKVVINDWVKEKTKGRIPELLASTSRSDILMLINTVYFKANWTTQFDKNRTRTLPFYPEGGISPKNIPMMRSIPAAQVSFLRRSDYAAVELPYANGKFAITLLLPAEGISANNLLQRLNQAEWDSIRQNLRPNNIDLTLPKVKIESEILMNDPLKTMGMPEAFDGLNADFRKITGGNPDLYISVVLQKTFLQMDEDGSEAAAATLVRFSRSLATPTHTLVFNRPFLLVIHEKESGLILFMGKVMDPGQ
jgi:serpin B